MELLDSIHNICGQENVSAIVLGESHDLSGKPNKIMGSIEELKVNLETDLDLPVYLQKEFMTTIHARGLPAQAGREGKEQNNARQTSKDKSIQADASAALSTKNNLLIKNRTQFENVYLLANNANKYGPFCAKFPGELGNSLKISVCSDGSQFMTEAGVPIWDWAHFFDNAPGTSEYAAAKNSANDEMHIMILDHLGRFTGTANTPLEKFSFVSKAFDAVSINGQSNFYKEVLSLTSQYIYALDPIVY
jgi:hypothetical protein